MSAVAQRWSEGRTRFRPSGECIRTSEYDVAAIAEDTPAKAFIAAHHYSHSYPAARERIGLYRRGALVGVAVFSHPANDKVLTSVFHGRAIDSIELGRFVLLDEVPGNGETWFLARCFEQLRARGLRGVVSFSDPISRMSADGRAIFPGHIGTIYQAHNAAYLGRGTARALRLLPDATVMSARALQKIRAGEKGWRPAAALLERHGAEACPDDNRREWLRLWLPRLTRPLSHPGNHKYAWSFDRRVTLTPAGPYPKGMH
jgi:hypothetical protein